MSEKVPVATESESTVDGFKASLWSNLMAEIGRRFREPLSYPTFIFVFFIVVVLVGGLGIWIPLFSADAASKEFNLIIVNALATYYLAIIATVSADVSFALFEKMSSPRKQGVKLSTEVSLWTFVLSLSVIIAIIGVLSLTYKTNESLVLILSIIGTIISLFLWWIVNSDNKKLKETTFDGHYDPEAAVGSEMAGEGVRNDGTAQF